MFIPIWGLFQHKMEMEIRRGARKERTIIVKCITFTFLCIFILAFIWLGSVMPSLLVKMLNVVEDDFSHNFLKPVRIQTIDFCFISPTRRKKKERTIYRKIWEQCNIKIQFSQHVKEEHALEPEQKASYWHSKKSPCMLFSLASVLPDQYVALSNLHGP